MTPNKHIFVFFIFLISSFFSLAIASPPVTAHGPDIQVDPPKLTLTVGGVSGTVRITSSEPIASRDDVSWSGLDDVIEVNTEVDGNTAVATLKALKYSPTPKVIKVTVRGHEPKTIQITTETLVKPENFPAEPLPEFTIQQDEPKNILILNPPQTAIPDEGLRVTSDNESFVSVMRSGTSIRITGIKPTPPDSKVRITVTSNGQIIKTYDVIVQEAMDRVEAADSSITLTEGDSFTLSKLDVRVIGKSGGTLTAEDYKPKYSTTNALATVNADETLLTAVRAPRNGEEPPKLLVKVKEVTRLTIPIRIIPAATTLNLRGQSNVVFVGKSETFSVEVLDSQGKPVPNAQIAWSIPTEDQTSLAIMNAQDTQVTVQGLSVPKEGVKLIATLRSPAMTKPPDPKTFFLTVKSASVSGFAPLRIRIDLLDSQTAKDLFGKKAADEFFISKIRLFNNLRNRNNEYGDSILVYSESLEVRVQLEMKDKGRNDGWVPLGTVDDSSYQALFGEPMTVSIPGIPQCEDIPQANFFARYRPYTFDIVANTHDRRDERSIRSRILTVANGLSSLASFVTSVAVPASSNDTRLGLDQFKGLLIPSFEKLFPSMKEVQRQNIITMVMRPLEEIPFGSDVTRILFIPKGRLHGMVPGKIFRIGGVSTTGACAEVGIIKKAGSSL